MATIPQAILQANMRGAELEGKTEYFGRGSTDQFQGEYNRLWKQAKKSDRRIQKYKSLMTHEGIGTETDKNRHQYADLRAKILKEEKILFRCIQKMKQRQEEKNRIDAREQKKRDNKEAISLNKSVRLEKSKLVPKKKIEVPEGVFQGSHELTYQTLAKGSTNKNPIYVPTTKEKIRQELFAQLNKKEKTPRQSNKEPIILKLKKKGDRYYKNNPDGYLSRNYEEPLTLTP